MVRLGFEPLSCRKSRGPCTCLEALSMLIVNKLRGGLKVRYLVICSQCLAPAAVG